MGQVVARVPAGGGGGEPVGPDDEAERQELMAQRDADDPGWRERFQPGSLGSREARHLASALAELVDRELRGHPAVFLRPHTFALASRAVRTLVDLHQALGMKHPSDKEG
jgi:hypothetical protein